MEATKPISSRLNDLLHRVIDGESRNAPLAYEIYSHARAEAIAEFLIAAKLTGKELQRFMHAECGGSMLEVLKEAQRRIERESVRRPVIVGRDYFPGREGSK